MMNPSFATLLLLALVLSSNFLESSMAQKSAWINCDAKCAARCAKAGRQARCLQFCGICCKKCSCVPSGTYGNKWECPCYNNMLNSKGKPKCP